MKHYNIPIFINHVGCPNSCVFCSQQKINGVETDIAPEEVKSIIDEYLGYLPKDSEIEVAFFGGTFTGISFELQGKYLEVVKPYIESGAVKGIRLSTRPDSIDERILTQLKRYGVTAIELGVQSLDQKVLDLTERNYPVSAVEQAVKKIKEYGIAVGIQLMIGLPGSDENKDYESAELALAMKPDMVRIYPTLVLSGTKMETMFREGKYLPLSLESAVKIAKRVYALFVLNRVNVIRVGLQPSEDLREEGVIVAGPFHAAFRELVESEIYYGFLREILRSEGELEIRCNERNVSKIIGNRGINRTKLGNKLRVKIDSFIGTDEIFVNGERYSKETIFKRGIHEENNIK